MKHPPTPSHRSNLSSPNTASGTTASQYQSTQPTRLPLRMLPSQNPDAAKTDATDNTSQSSQPQRYRLPIPIASIPQPTTCWWNHPIAATNRRCYSPAEATRRHATASRATLTPYQLHRKVGLNGSHLYNRSLFFHMYITHFLLIPRRFNMHFWRM